MATAREPQEEMLLEEREAYASYAAQPDSRSSSSSRSPALWLALGVVGVAAVVGVALGASAHSSAKTAAADVRATRMVLDAQEAVSSATSFSGMMLMTQPVCRQAHDNYLVCLDLINTAENLIRDYANASFPTKEIEANVLNGTYNVGNSVAYLTRDDSSVEAMPGALKNALALDDINLTVGMLADLGKCDYVWANVACLTMAEIRHSPECNSKNESDQCVVTTVPVIHILSTASVDVTSDGRARRASAETIAAVAGGVPDVRTVAEVMQNEGQRRRGIGGPCGSGLGERLMCHCNSRGCGYLDYYKDPEGRWGNGI